MSYTLEGQVRFVFEKRTEPYRNTVMGVSQKKIVHGSKNIFGASNLFAWQKDEMYCS